ncbi:hypothetical protein KL933_000145 [Ogataea haglerorum]|uniref:Uncharacterized protein n=1 Tax=Ogataea haglerorum TaxID=1937702 RepID=A0AAN6DA65_9ASCO|nr:uncharacterized protein KL911_001403 [Ogataea haglerorum]KAG7730350.1 hypothetical protein KL933_000145 [Ogataea haglerorum]KAG7756601.1 hypothetical protein KL911_001403 [Ogataea haglerorum]KAG7785843.1 hypothetical protein KL945_003622 [Ogataea haglerorum]KAG7793923.1 hypothetical protein KL910_000618 [Ogataea haglerorum]
MSTIYSEPEVERFLNNFSELHSAREQENRSRLQSLEQEVDQKRRQYELSPKKKPLVPKKAANLDHKVKVELEKKEVEEFVRAVDLDKPAEKPNAPKPIKFEDVMKQPIFTPPAETSTPAPRKTPIVKPKPQLEQERIDFRASLKPAKHSAPLPKQKLSIPVLASTVEETADKAAPFFGVQLSPTKKTFSAPESKKPEALSKLGTLKPAPPVSKKPSETPEALAKLSSLAKAKPTPKPAPPKPEALLMLSSLKKTKEPVPIQKLPPRAKTEPQMGIPLPGLAEPRHLVPRAMTEPKKPALDMSEFDKQGRPLEHVTKTRSKGPKRRPPKANKYGEAAAQPKKMPPPIRKSSRQVSSSELFI